MSTPYRTFDTGAPGAFAAEDGGGFFEGMPVVDAVFTILVIVAFVGSFFGFWFGTPPVVQNESPTHGKNVKASLKAIQQSLDAYNRTEDTSLVICKSCSLNAGAFVGYTLLVPGILGVFWLIAKGVLGSKGMPGGFGVPSEA